LLTRIAHGSPCVGAAQHVDLAELCKHCVAWVSVRRVASRSFLLLLREVLGVDEVERQLSQAATGIAPKA